MVGILKSSLNGIIELSSISEDICPKKQFTDHHFDALFSAVVAYLSTRTDKKGWKNNLHTLDNDKDECLAYAFGDKNTVIYAWHD